MTTDAILIVTAGRGPIECRRAVAFVVEEIAKEAEAAGLSLAVDLGSGDPPGSAILSIAGEGSSHLAGSWTGTILCIDEAARGRGGRRNWYVGVHRSPPPVDTVDIRESDIKFETMRAGGPGGQHQNTTDSAVRAVHLPTGLVATARDGRSQHRNRAIAVQRIRELAAVRHRMEARDAQQRQWLDRIDVVRGNPARTYSGARRLEGRSPRP